MSLCLLLVFILFRVFFAFSDDCPQGLHEAFKMNLNLTGNCRDVCTVVDSVIWFGHHSWTGFCYRDTFVFFPDWSCETDNIHHFVVMSQRGCKMKFGKENRRLDKNCLETYNRVRCGKVFDLTSRSEDLKYTNSNEFLQQNYDFRLESRRILKNNKNPTPRPQSDLRKRSAPTYNFPTGQEPVHKRTTTSAPDYPAPSSTDQSPTDVISTSLPLTTIPSNNDELCELNEVFFEGHCYFFMKAEDIDAKLKSEEAKFIGDHKTLLLSMLVCKMQHHEALGLAIETKEEKEFVMRYSKDYLGHFADSFILTSGIKLPIRRGKWFGWNSFINESLLGINLADNNEESLLFFNPLTESWLTESYPDINRISDYGLLCERVHNPKNILPDLHAKCLNLYRRSECYNPTNHTAFCCTKDDRDELWFGCSGQSVVKHYEGGTFCAWHCHSDGIFRAQYPVCLGGIICSRVFNSIPYVASVTKYAISDCPNHLFGASTWHCNENRTFSGFPDYSLCCRKNELCVEVDSFLRTWRACPLSKAVKKIECPRGSAKKKALVEWYCRGNGRFAGSSPDYSRCNESETVSCRGKDNYGREWTGVAGSITEMICPPSFNGFCFWKCGESGKFENDQPDCTKCRAEWMEEIADKIKNGANHEDVMEDMVNHTKTKDLTVGFAHVLNLTSECVNLFKKQYSANQTQVFDKFLNHYSKILKNVAGNSSTWSAFDVEKRKDYSNQILKTTQTATFAKLSLEGNTTSSQSYNATFATLALDGFDFFVSYNPSMKGYKFPLVNFSGSDWQLQVEAVNRSDSNFAAVGLVMNYSLSSLMFPLGKETQDLEINAPAVTFAVATPRDGEAVVVSDVVVSITFKHTKRTRFPDSQVIRRKLHEGEKPSGIFNSTVCHYYRDDDWSTKGCTVTFSSKEQTNCTCTHLSTISLLMSVHKYTPNPTLETVSLFSCGISVISLTLALIVFYTFDSIRNDRVLIGKNLCFCLLFGHVLLISVMDKKFFYLPDELCSGFALILHYVFMAAFFWMLVEGCHLYRMLVLVFDSNKEYRFAYLIIGYGMPLAVVATTELIGFAYREQPYGEDELCWLKSPNYVWAFTGPVVLITSINLLILIKAVTLAIASNKRMEKSKFANMMLWIKGWFSLSTLLGVTWLLGLAYINYDELFVYLFVVLNGLQGFFIFLFRCVCNEQYRTAFVRKFKFFISNSNQLKKYKKFDKSGSGTKLFVITQNSSKSVISSELQASSYDSAIFNPPPNQINMEKNILKNLESKDRDDMAEDEKSTGINSHFRENSIGLDTAQDSLRNRFLSSSPCPTNGGDDFPELSYHTNKY